jgi:OFA family oxalate/formate antiporter-like MFS transporter
MLVELCLGVVYAWSVFTGELCDRHGFSAADTQWVFGVLLGTNALVMLGAGRLLERLGPRRVTLLGGLLFGGGFVLTGLLPLGFATQLVGLGLVTGAGLGLTYLGPIAAAMRWFPAQKGLVTGLTVAGFGLGSLVWVQLVDARGGLLERLGLQGTYLVLGGLFVLGIGLGGLLLELPPGRRSGEEPDPAPGAVRAMLGTGQFWLLSAIFLCASLAGLMVIGVNRLAGRDALVASGAYPDLDAAARAASLAFALAFALGNGLGRVAWGFWADRLGVRRALMGLLLWQAALMAGLGPASGSLLGLSAGLALVGFNYGGAFALMPVATAQLFGPRAFGLNYPFVNLAYGLGALCGPPLAGLARDALAGRGAAAWWPAFWAAGGLCLVAAGLAGRLALTRRSP